MNKFLQPQVVTGTIDKNYITGNILIKMVLNRLLTCIADTLFAINVKAAKGLEVGCGEGNIIQFLQNRGVIDDIVAIDLQPEKLKAAKHRIRGTTFLASDISRLIFKNDIFDYILAIEMFEHLPDPTKALIELNRVAKSDAYFLISVPHEPFFHWGNLARGQYLPRMGKTPSHVNFWNRKQFRLFLSNHVNIIEEHFLTTFPWLFYLCQFPTKAK